MRRLACLLLIMAILSPLCFVGSVVDAYDVFWTLHADTTWTRGSIHQLSSHLIVPAGVTLTIEPGVRVDVKEFQIQVQGTVIARGTSQNKIVFTTTGDRNSWLYYPHGLPHLFSFYRNASLEEQNETNSIIENAIITEPIDVFAQITITNSSLQGAVILENQSSVLSENEISDVHVLGGTPTITNNTITDMLITEGTPTIANNIINGRVLAGGGSPIFLGNTFLDGITLSGGQCTITDNEFRPTNNKTIIKAWGTYANISNNKIIGNNNTQIGIDVAEPSSMPFYFDLDSRILEAGWVTGKPGNASIEGNHVYNCQIGISTHYSNVQICKNVISNNQLGISINSSYSSQAMDNIAVDIHENTISNNSVGIQYFAYQSPTNISNNSIFGNLEYNFKLGGSNDTIVANNWWGTTDNSAINQTIYDSKNDHSLGTVTFTPYLTAPYAQSTSSLQLLIENQALIIVATVVGISCIATVAIALRRKRKK